MTIIYIPRVIESQEQADQLPDGTVAIRDGHWPRILLRDETGQHWAAGDTGPLTPDMRGWTALIATEADRHESEPTGTRHRAPDIFERAPFTLWLTEEGA